MSLLDLPNELLCKISEDLRTTQDIASFSQVNQHLLQLTTEHLYRFDARQGKSSALLWAATHGRLQTTKKALGALQRNEQPAANCEADSEADTHTTDESATNPADIALLQAAENGHASLVRLLVEHGADLEWRDPERRQNAMEAACFNGRSEVVKLLLESGEDPSSGHYMRPYPIQCAAMMGHTDIVELLVDAGASVDTCSGRPAGGSYPPLQLAVRGGHKETAKLLITKGATINLRIGGMHTALEEAVRGDRLWAVKLLLASSAIVFAPASGLVRCPALQMARMPGREEMYKLLKDQPVYLWPRDGRCLAQDGSIGARRVEDLRSREGIPPHLRRSERILRKHTA
jgi:hypothetical protein